MTITSPDQVREILGVMGFTLLSEAPSSRELTIRACFKESDRCVSIAVKNELIGSPGEKLAVYLIDKHNTPKRFPGGELRKTIPATLDALIEFLDGVCKNKPLATVPAHATALV